MRPNRQLSINQLLKNNQNFRRLFTEHRKFDSALRELNRKTYLSADEQNEIHRLKKLKLLSKDRMEEILAQYETGSQTQPTVG